MNSTEYPPDKLVAFLIALDRSDTDAMRRIRRQEPDLFPKLRADHRWIVCDAARKSSPEAVRDLIELGAPIDERDSNLFTGLCWAVSCGRYEVARVLLECGADPNLDCPLFRVASSDKVQDRIAMAKLLLDHGADVNQPFLVEDMPPRNALSEAIKRGHSELAEFLVARGAKPLPASKRKR
ncbi:MAG TPA: ankyrin repeat domain-containing protein [Gemmataceae bacterium]|nr:ankyrin repeat domain-containing protein [Gemmataceae bacterium]